MDIRATKTPARAGSESSRGRRHLDREASRGVTPLSTGPVLSSRAKSPEKFKFIPMTSEISRAPSVSQSLNQLNACRWSWCRFTFSDNADLIHHVVHDHVRQAVAVRRRDLPIVQMAEEGVGQSLSISGLVMSVSSQSDTPSPMKRRRTDDNAADVEPTSSLPSPPISSPTPLPAAFAEEGQAQTFASLGKDSPIEDPLEVQDEYFDLTLESMITREIDRKIAPSTYSPPAAQQFPTPSAQDPQLSPSSSFGSQNSVEKQLTQSLNLDEAQEDLKYTPSQPRHIHDVPFNGVLGDRTPVQATPGLVRQAWYTNQSSHSKRYTIHSQSSSDSSSQPTSSPPNSRQETLTEARAKPVYSGSGTIQYSPSPAGQPYSQSHIYSMAFSQSGTQDSELGLSYPPQLQTQAPYQSQSFSQ